MATKTMSVFLIKSGFDAGACLDDAELLEETPMAGVFPAGSRFFLRRGVSRKPWWVDYFGVNTRVLSRGNGALVFIPTRGRWFALTFGSARHNLNDSSYEHDFGTRVVLNCINPEKLKSTDVVDPGSARRQRTQLPFDADLSYFGDLDDSQVLKSLTGKVGGDFADLARSVTGAYNLRVATSAPPERLVGFLDECLALSSQRDYLQRFPRLRWLEPATDPDVLKGLNAALIQAVFDVNAPISLTVPEIVNYEAESVVCFTGAGSSLYYDDVYIKHYREYLNAAGVGPDDLTIDSLKTHKLRLMDDEYTTKHSYSIFRSLVCEVPSEGKYVFHLSDGVWYRVSRDLLQELQSYLDGFWRLSGCPAYTGPDEAHFNTELADALGGYCLDKSSIAPDGQHGVEPCDVLRVRDDRVELIHVKIGTTSDKLSHHFNQGANSLGLLIERADCRQKLITLVAERAGGICPNEIRALIETKRFAVSFVIASHREEGQRSLNIPLFSRLSLRRQIRSIVRAQTPVSFEFVKDVTAPRIIKSRKARASMGDGSRLCRRCNIEYAASLLQAGLCEQCA